MRVFFCEIIWKYYGNCCPGIVQKLVGITTLLVKSIFVCKFIVQLYVVYLCALIFNKVL